MSIGSKVDLAKDARAYWLGRWQRGETGWHQSEPEPVLVQAFERLQPTRVFVPLCGKSLDLRWLARMGHEVIGVEWSEVACREFFEEAGEKCEVSRAGSFQIMKGDRVTLLNGSFFDLRPSDLGKVGAVYDRAALIALSREDRVRYATRMTELLAEAGLKGLEFLQVSLERVPPDEEGPPFSVDREELERLYGQTFKLTHVQSEEVELKSPAKSLEHVYRLASV